MAINTYYEQDQEGSHQMTTILSRRSVEELRHVKNNKNASFPVIVMEPRPHQAKLLRSKLNDDRFIILEKELIIITKSNLMKRNHKLRKLLYLDLMKF